MMHARILNAAYEACMIAERCYNPLFIPAGVPQSHTSCAIPHPTSSAS